jgi:3-deoxy-D-manno-octulosonic-acid transferase
VLVLYNLLLAPLLLLVAPLALIWLLLSPRTRAGLSERLTPLRAGARGDIWVHAASLGEAAAAAPLIDALVAEGRQVRATTTTVTGRDRLRDRFPGLPVRLVPLDLPGLTGRSARAAGAGVLVLVETELWPNLIQAVAARGGRVVVVSGRVSDRSFPRYRALRPLFAAVLRRVHRVGARSEPDRLRFVALGLPSQRSLVIGDLKLDVAAPAAPSEALRAALGKGPLLVGGSTHPGEEEALLAAWRALRQGPAPDLRLVLAPRHPERARAALANARRVGARAALRSEGAAAAEVAIVDTVGELGSIYTLAELVFCGGSLAPVGGHNLLEPVRAGRVVVHGPHLENQRTLEALLAPLGVLHRVADAADLERCLQRLWADSERNAPAVRATERLEAHRGATARALEVVLAALERGGDA